VFFQTLVYNQYWLGQGVHERLGYYIESATYNENRSRES